MKLQAARRMRLREVLVVYVDDVDTEEEEVLTTFAAELGEAVRIPVVILTPNMTLESVSADQMRNAGWVRRKDGGGG